jgi:hypothetical protein
MTCMQHAHLASLPSFAAGRMSSAAVLQAVMVLLAGVLTVGVLTWQGQEPSWVLLGLWEQAVRVSAVTQLMRGALLAERMAQLQERVQLQPFPLPVRLQVCHTRRW